MRVIIFFLVQNSINRTLENSKMLLLSKEATDNDRSLKTQLLVTSNDSQEKLSSENVWKNNVFFQDLRPDFNLRRKHTREYSVLCQSISFVAYKKR